MHRAVKQYADSGDISKLRFSFLDSLDVDPTFEEYKEDFEYCKNISGLFENHAELKPFEKNSSRWNEDYWVALKMDMQENFSLKRFEHMKEVAKVFYAKKIERLQDERREAAAAKAAAEKAAASKSAEPVNTQPVRIKPAETAAPEQEQVKERVVKRYSEPRVPAAPAPQSQKPQGGGSPKKSKGAAVPILAIAILVLIVVLLIVLIK